MTTATFPLRTTPSLADRLAGRVRDVAVLTTRNLVHIAREPLRLSDVTIQPILFTLLFVYVFGAGVSLPGGGSYSDFAIAGLLALNLTTSAIGTAVGLTSDLATGVIDRFRSLAMWPAAVLVGRSLTDLLTAMLCTAIVALVGLIVGWTPDGTPLQTAAGFAVFLLFGYALSLGMRLPRDRRQRHRIRPEHRPDRPIPPLIRLQRAGRPPAHAGRAAHDRRLEPRQRRHRRQPPAVSQPQPLSSDPRLADAAPGRGRAAVVDRATGRLRPARRVAVQAAHDRVARIKTSAT